MKKNIFSIAAILLATVVIFSSCGKEDLNDPVVTLTGDAVMELDLGDTWDDPGATATDEEDGKITSKIVVVGEVDTDKVGADTIVYKVTDKAGNEGSATRIVNVKAGKLVHNYVAEIFDGETDDFIGEYDITPVASVEYNKIVFLGFAGLGENVKFDARVEGYNIALEDKEIAGEAGGQNFWVRFQNINGTYEKAGNNNYVITGFEYEEVWSIDANFTDTQTYTTKEVWTLQ